MTASSISDIQPGDRVIYMDATDQWNRDTVERVTKTQIILNNGKRFRRCDGRPVGHLAYYLKPDTNQ